MKKGVILFMTILFMIAMSVLILKNMSDTNKFMENQNYMLNNSQLLISIKNLKDELVKQLKNPKLNLAEKLETEDFAFPLKVEGIELESVLKKYDRVNVNTIAKDSKELENLFLENDIFDYALFKQLYDEKAESSGGKDFKINTKGQLSWLIDKFIKKSYNNKILDIEDEIGLVDGSEMYELDIKVNFNNAKAKAYYVLKKDGGVEYFDISFI